MGLRIKELAKEKDYLIADLASILDISPVTLSQSIHGNPTLKRLEEIANAMNVDVSELFEQPKKNDIHGCLYVNGEPRLVKTKSDLKMILKEIDKWE